MGGRPLFGLNVVGWNVAELSTDLLVDVLAGIADAAAEEGWVVVGGHTVDDPEPKVGVAVVGEVRHADLLTKQGLRPGDALILTKSLGVGVAVTALKAGAAPAGIVDAAVASMLRSNAEAARVALHHAARAATDVTGFGLLGHLRGLLDASGVGAAIDTAAVPVLPGIAGLVDAGHVPGGTTRNLAWVRERLDPGQASEAQLAVLADPQTSGGLLFGVAATDADDAVDALRRTGHTAAVVGEVVAGPPHIVLR